MNITKFEHSCLRITDNDEIVIIDPGEYSNLLPTAQQNVVAVIVTHIHPDHCDPTKIAQILSNSPGCQLFSTPEVASTNPELPFIAVHAGETKNAGSFTFEFFGGVHEIATIVENVGVLINNTLYYPGDSYTLPQKPIEILAAPASAPWLRMTEATKFVQDISPRLFFPTHNALLSEIGESIQYSWFERTAAQIDAEWRVLKPGEELSV